MSENSTRRARQLRRTMTAFERTLWAHLRDRRLAEFKFRRQHPIAGYVVDFFCAECGLGVEIDGDSHAFQTDYDQIRTECLKSAGDQLVRYTNSDVRTDIDSVLNDILAHCRYTRQTEPEG